MRQLLDTFGWYLALLVAHDLLLVMIFDVLAYANDKPTVSEIIRHSWLAWPVGIMAGLTIGIIVLSHFLEHH